MILIYVDTSVVVAAFTNEAAADRVTEYLKAASTGLMISWLVETEFSAALSIKLRRGDIDMAARNVALSQFRRYVKTTLTICEVRRRHFVSASDLADMHLSGLRAGDALHLAIAAERGAALCTLDKSLAKAGMELGIATELV